MVVLSSKQQVRLYLLIPPTVSLLGALLSSWPLFAISALTLFVLTGSLPMCAGRESLWIFLTALPTSSPINVFLIRRLASSWLVSGIAETRLDGMLWSVLVFLTMLSIEELALLSLSRCIWPKQHGDEVLQKWIAEDEGKL